MKFKVETSWLTRREEFIELDPKNFLHCTNIEELNEEIEAYITDHLTYPEFGKLDQYQEMLGLRYFDNWPFETLDTKSFYLEWQRLKGLPQEL